MSMTDTAPIACTLTAGEFKDRLAWIGILTKDSLCSHERRDLVLDLRYAPEARDRVREMVRNEQTCCSFLTFDLSEQPDEIRLVITAPEAAREAADVLFEQFVAGAHQQNAGAREAPSQSPTSVGGTNAYTGTRAAVLAAITLATGAVACGACCVLPFALPAVVLAGTGSVLAWLAGAHVWITGLAVLAVLGAWAWIARQTLWTQRKPATSTLYVMAGATALALIAAFWPLIEHGLLRLML
jgi:hypothetical protein